MCQVILLFLILKQYSIREKRESEYKPRGAKLYKYEHQPRVKRSFSPYMRGTNRSGDSVLHWVYLRQWGGKASDPSPGPPAPCPPLALQLMCSGVHPLLGKLVSLIADHFPPTRILYPPPNPRMNQTQTSRYYNILPSYNLILCYFYFNPKTSRYFSSIAFLNSKDSLLIIYLIYFIIFLLYLVWLLLTLSFLFFFFYFFLFKYTLTDFVRNNIITVE